MAYSFLDLAREVLQAVSSPMTYQEIWQAAESSGLTDKLKSSGKTPWATLGARLYIEVRDNPDSDFEKITSNPARFQLRGRQPSTPDLPKSGPVPPVVIKKHGEYLERDLHPLLTYFAYSNPPFNRGRPIYTKTIFHEKSTKGGYNEWVHPDMVGFYLPLAEWHQNVVDLNRLSDNNSLRIYSFELKRALTKANYREAYFQAVSNSSWAHEGYLVAAEVLNDDDFLAELERLASSFGIGIIELEPKDIDASKVLFPARLKPGLDWETINKLCEQNPDFADFLQDVRIDFKEMHIHKAEYDPVLKDIKTYIKNKLGLETAGD